MIRSLPMSSWHLAWQAMTRKILYKHYYLLHSIIKSSIVSGVLWVLFTILIFVIFTGFVFLRVMWGE